MKVTLFTGSHPRHLFLAASLYNAGLLEGLLIEEREHFIPMPPHNLSVIDHDNFVRHFQDREEAEGRFFKIHDIHFDIPTLEIKKEELNSEGVKNWLDSINPEGIITYGVHKISGHLLSCFPKHSWNLHGGLSPWFRGNITLFWPFYFLKPNWAGMTIHQLSTKMDGGDIIHHSVPKLEYGDGVHDVACKAVIQGVEDLVEILKVIEKDISIKTVPQKSNGKLFTGEDWKPQHLRLIYQTFNNDIVDHYLNGDIQSDEPQLIDFFKNNFPVKFIG